MLYCDILRMLNANNLMKIEGNDDYVIYFCERTNRYVLAFHSRYEQTTWSIYEFNSIDNLRLVTAVLVKDRKEYGDYIFNEEDFKEVMHNEEENKTDGRAD